ncbi:MAG TPA: MOSC domain-containing protein [Chloroflexota bacterium]|nr:MOSC domain-containing protein [Chloroflexota bacterium]
MEPGRIHQINLSKGGVPKLPVEGAEVNELGIVGDEHRDTRGHGGPERALCFYALELIEELREEGHPVAPGTMGENITTIGIDHRAVEPGDRFALGEEVVVEVTRYTTPCINIRESFQDGDFTRVLQTTHPGWSRYYTRILQGGRIRPGDAVRKLS